MATSRSTSSKATVAVRVRTISAGPRTSHVPPCGDVQVPCKACLLHWPSCSAGRMQDPRDRKSTRLNSSHSQISYAVFCLKKKKKSHKHESSAVTRAYDR